MHCARSVESRAFALHSATCRLLPEHAGEAALAGAAGAAGAGAAGALGAAAPDCGAGLGAGALAGAAGVTGADAAEVAPVPTEFVAVTVNVYDAPFVRPLTVQVVAGVAGATDVTEHDSPVPAVTV